MAENIASCSQEIGRVLTRVAHKIVGDNRKTQDIICVGVLTHRVPLAYCLALLIQYFEGLLVSVGSLNFRSNRDDISHRTNMPEKEPKNNFTRNITGRIVILVDEVLSTGRSVRAAINVLVRLSRLKYIQLATLADRDHRETPGRAEFVGVIVPCS